MATHKTEMQMAFAKQNELVAHYKKSRVLIVEDSAEARGVIRGMMTDAGVEKLDLATSGQEAIDCLRQHTYDIVLSDYNLGKGKDGQQVLEEARFSKYLGYTTIYIMITAETSVEMVMGALEYQPDSYLSKPFTKKELMARIGRVLEIKMEYKEIEKQFGQKNYPEAVLLCDKKIESQAEPAMRALRIKGECLLQQQEYSMAKILFSEVLSEREIPWAKIGLGKTLYFLREYEESAALFRELIVEQPNVVESYDWLARVQKAQKLPREAQDTLELAVSKSPKAVLRQLALARIALTNRSYLVAEDAFRRSIVLASNSCYQSPEIYLQYVRTLLVKVCPTTTDVCSEAYREAIVFLGRLRKEFDQDPQVKFRATLLESLVHYSRGKVPESEALIETARRQFQKIDEKAREKLSDEYVSSLSLMGHTTDCEMLIKEIQKSSENQDLENRLLSRARDGKRRMENEKLSTEAMELYQNGQIFEAHGKFKKAASKSGASANVLMNAVSFCLELAEKEDINKEKWRLECGAYLDRLSVLDRCDHRYESYLSYVDRYEQL